MITFKTLIKFEQVTKFKGSKTEYVLQVEHRNLNTKIHL